MQRMLYALAVLATLLATPVVHAQQQVQFFAGVVDRLGNPIPDLAIDDLLVTENGAEGKVLKVEPIDWPIKVSILVDNGVGMGQRLASIRTGVKGLLEALPDGVETALLTTAPQPRFVRRATTDRAALLEGVDRIAPDTGAPRFVEALNEAAARVQQEKGNYFPVVIVLGSTGAEGSAVRDREIRRMLERFSERAATVHVVMLSTGARSPVVLAAAANQIEIGMAVAKATGGRYENIAAASRIETLLPEIGAQVAKSHALQSHQYRITALRPDGASGPLVDFGMSTRRPGLLLTLTSDGHMP